MLSILKMAPARVFSAGLPRIEAFTTRRLMIAVTFLALFSMAARISLDSDTWWHLRAGEWILENHSTPLVDPFSYTRLGAAWRYPGWLVEAPMAWIYRQFGPGGLNLWTAGMVTLAYGLVWAAMRGGPFLRAFVLIPAATAGGVYWSARPHLVTLVLAAAFLWVLERNRLNERAPAARRLWWLPPLMAIWVNSHGGFAVGFLIWGAYLAGELWAWATGRREGRAARVKSLAGVGLLMLGAVCLSPAGPAMLAYPFKTVSIGALQDYIEEWQSPDFHNPIVQPFAWLLLACLAAVGSARRRLALVDFLLIGGLAYLSLLARRNIALFSLAAPLVIARSLQPGLAAWIRQQGWGRLESKPARSQGLLNLLLLGVLLLAAAAKLSLVLPREANRQAIAKSAPVAAVEWLRTTQPEGRLFNSYNWGAYLLWALPETPVFIDGRTDLYDDALMQTYLDAVQARPGWTQILDDWQVQVIMIEPDLPLARELPRAGWTPAYHDEQAVIFLKENR